MRLIELKNITKSYFAGEMKLTVLDDISLNVEAGEYIALMGASGSGKSTLMNILGCLDRPTSGEYFFNGQEIGGISSDLRAQIRNKHIGFIFQSFNLLPRTSALENVIMPLSYTNGNLSDKEMKERGRAMLEQVGLKDRMQHTPAQLSGGQQQRVAIARALINHPPVIFADEPTGNLDTRTSCDIMNIFAELSSKNISIILVTHAQEVADYAKRIIRIQDGKIIK